MLLNPLFIYYVPRLVLGPRGSYVSSLCDTLTLILAYIYRLCHIKSYLLVTLFVKKKLFKSNAL